MSEFTKIGEMVINLKEVLAFQVEEKFIRVAFKNNAGNLEFKGILNCIDSFSEESTSVEEFNKCKEFLQMIST